MSEFENAFARVARVYEAGALYQTRSWTYLYNSSCVTGWPEVHPESEFINAQELFVGPLEYNKHKDRGQTKLSEDELRPAGILNILCKITKLEAEQLRDHKLFLLMWPADGCLTLLRRTEDGIYEVIFKGAAPDKAYCGAARLTSGDAVFDFKEELDYYIAMKKNCTGCPMTELAVNPKDGSFFYRPMPAVLKPEPNKIVYNNKEYSLSGWNDTIRAYTQIEEIEMAKLPPLKLNRVKKDNPEVAAAVTTAISEAETVPEDFKVKIEAEIAAKQSPPDNPPWKEDPPPAPEKVPEVEPEVEPAQEPEAAPAAQESPEIETAVKRTRKPRPAALIKSFDYVKATEYAVQALPEKLTPDEALNEMRAARELIIAFTRRQANITNFLGDQIKALDAQSKVLSTLKQALSAVKL